MGCFYGSVHLRTEDASAVLAAVAAVARKNYAKYLIAPPRDGWIAAYPHEAGQDQTLGAAVAKAVGGDAVWVSLHDDDVFEYAVWRNGKRVDEYNSSPDYFGKASAAVKKRTRGTPERFANLLADGNTPAKLKEQLNGKPTAQLVRFAACLGLSGVETSYDYLMDGETDSVHRFDQFVHIPSRKAEIAAKSKQDAATEKEQQRLRGEGLLLCDLIIEKSGNTVPIPCMAVGPGPHGFLFSIKHYSARENDNTLFELAPPFSGGIRNAKIQIAASLRGMLSSPRGRYLAIEYGSGNWSTDVWDLVENRRLISLPQTGAVQSVAFDAGEQTIVSLSNGLLTIAPIAGGHARSIMLDPSGRGICLHPTDGCMVSGASHGGVLIYDLATGSIKKRLGPTLRSPLQQEADIELMLGPLRLGRADPERVASYTQQLRSTIDQGVWSLGDDPIFSCHFSQDGQLLICANSRTLSVFEWEKLRTADTQMPLPLYQVAAVYHEYEFMRHPMSHGGPVYDAIHLPDQQTVLFCEHAGVIRALSLQDGSVRELIRPPKNGRIAQIHLSRDHSLLAFAYRPGYEANSSEPYRIQIWDLARLLSDRAH